MRTRAVCLLTIAVVIFAVMSLLGAPSAVAGAPCVDPTPGGGGTMFFKGFGTPEHMSTREGDVCFDGSDVWRYSTLYVTSPTQYIGIRVVELSGAVTVTLQQGSDTPMTLIPGDAYTSGITGEVQFTITVTGIGPDIASYRIHVCRAITDPCPLSDTVTPKPGDANCDSSIDPLDALIILQRVAGLLPDVSCPNVANVDYQGVADSDDALLILQYVAGLIDRLPSQL